MIDAETLAEIEAGTRRERAMAVLLGLVAVVAAALVLVQAVQGQREARENAVAAQLSADVTTRLVASQTFLGFRFLNLQRATQVMLEGGARRLVALEAGSAVEDAIGVAETEAGRGLAALVEEMAALPPADGPLDAYARAALGTGNQELGRLVAEQNAARDAATIASARSNEAVLGLSIVALAGVLAGLAAVVGRGRSGRALLAVAAVALGVATAVLVLASGLLAGG